MIPQPEGRRVLLVLRPGSTLYGDYFNSKGSFSLDPFALADGKSDGGEPPADNIQFLGKVHANAQGGTLVSAKQPHVVAASLGGASGEQEEAINRRGEWRARYHANVGVLGP